MDGTDMRELLHLDGNKSVGNTRRNRAYRTSVDALSSVRNVWRVIDGVLLPLPVPLAVV